ncbi:sulfotransferase family protein [Phytohabitans houttuyneae]|uniref:Sulfotransferase family protein n=1 Tax=Phytohabitans houttuyneae TaxID=1076126 RepID=A0A6V8KB82_9ACTN|nr:sulfotransferase [Phytohabitans houttuyneae]GFJ78035.1 sulfotransferase family protein [Phytohabitans houttuyneae]
MPPFEPARLVSRPVFILAPIRSGSTLLRCLLNSHPAVLAPHELHLRYLDVDIGSEYTDLAMGTLGWSRAELRHMLWDRILHRQLQASGRAVVVDKSPSNTFIVDELRACWPEARFIRLRRHPAAIAASIVAADDGRDLAAAVEHVLRVAALIDERTDLDGAAVVRYEDLTADPAKVCAELCEFLGIPADPRMVDYGRHDHGPFVYGIGDWSERIRSGRVQPPARVPHPCPAALHELCERWGYPVAAEPVESPMRTVG